MESQNQASVAATSLSPQVVGNAFVHQYYNILYQSPEHVHKFYQENSRLGRPGEQGVLSSVTTLQAINEKILSMDYRGLISEIKTVDAQESLNDGVLVLVTGYLTENDNIKRKFTQSFFLATQDKGYFVLNDIFRYMEEDNQQLDIASPQVGHEPQLPQDEHVRTHYESPQDEEKLIEEVYNTTKQAEDSIADEGTTYDEVVADVPNSLNESKSTLIKEEEPKKSYASILRNVRENAASSASSTQAPSTVKVAPSNQEKQSDPVPNQSKPDNPPIISSTPHASNIVGDALSVYLKGLPLNITPSQLEEEFQRFGPIKPGGVQVRSTNLQGFCFGFIEFETADAFHSAIEASPLTIGGREVHVEAKRPSRPTRAGGSSGRGMYGGRMGGFRGEGRGGRSHGRGADFRGRGRSRGGPRGDAVVYQRVEHAGPVGGGLWARPRGPPS